MKISHFTKFFGLPWQRKFLRSPMVMTKKNTHFRCPTSLRTFWYINKCGTCRRHISQNWGILLHYSVLSWARSRITGGNWWSQKANLCRSTWEIGKVSRPRFSKQGIIQMPKCPLSNAKRSPFWIAFKSILAFGLKDTGINRIGRVRLQYCSASLVLRNSSGGSFASTQRLSLGELLTVPRICVGLAPHVLAVIYKRFVRYSFVIVSTQSWDDVYKLMVEVFGGPSTVD